MHPFRIAMTLAVVSCAGAVTPLLAQQAAAAAPVAGTSSPRAGDPVTTLRGPRVSPGFQRFEPRLAPAPSKAAFVSASGGPIVISTLALVLIIILVVLLV